MEKSSQEALRILADVYPTCTDMPMYNIGLIVFRKQLTKIENDLLAKLIQKVSAVPNSFRLYETYLEKKQVRSLIAQGFGQEDNYALGILPHSNYSIFLNLAIERSESYFEQAGRFCLVAVCRVKNADDVITLHALQI